MKLYFNFGFGLCTKYFMKYVVPSIRFRQMMVSHMYRFIKTTHDSYIDDRDKYKIYTFKKLGDRI